MLLMVSAAVPELLKVMLCAALLVPTSWLGKVRLVGRKPADTVVPVPDRGTVWGLPDALSKTDTKALRAPAAVGVNVTLMVQLPPDATLLPQVLV